MPGRQAVVLVHGSLDRAASFKRVIRRVLDATTDVGVVAYDRRGYGGSRHGAPAPLPRHIDDLLEVAAAIPGDGPAVAVGHSLGGVVVLGAAATDPRAFGAVGAFEPPLPWVGFRRPRPGPPSWASPDADPAAEAERFFRRMVGDQAWERLPESAREERRADGPAMLADLRSFSDGAPFDLATIEVPVVFGRGGPASAPHHREGAAWAADTVPRARLIEIERASHGAHLSHPGAFAEFVLAVLAADVEAREARSA